MQVLKAYERASHDKPYRAGTSGWRCSGPSDRRHHNQRRIQAPAKTFIRFTGVEDDLGSRPTPQAVIDPRSARQGVKMKNQRGTGEATDQGAGKMAQTCVRVQNGARVPTHPGPQWEHFSDAAQQIISHAPKRLAGQTPTDVAHGPSGWS